MQGCAGRTRSVSLVIPAYNEEAGIATAIAEADDALVRLAENYEILVVDDGSRDRTFEVAREAARCRPNVRVLRHDGNRGYGAALRTGFEAARFERVSFTDADCQFHLDDLSRLLPLAEESPVVVGIRVDRQDPWRRRFLSKGYNLLARTLLGTRVRDCDCALKVFHRDALHHMLPNSTNFFVNTEMLSRARQKNFAIAEAGVRHRPRLKGASKVSIGDVPRTLRTLLPYWWSNVLFPSRPGERMSRGTAFDLLLVLTVAVLLFFTRLKTPLLEPEEGRYAEIPRQMLATGEWIVPTLHGQAYLDKPPLMYWAVMASYRLFGVHDWAARIVPGLAGVLTVAIAWAWASRVAGRRAALLGAMMLALTPGFVYYGRMLTMNGLLALFTTATLAAGHAALLGEKRSRGLWLLAGLCAGLGLMTKGPVALALTLPPLAVLALLDNRCHRPRVGSILVFLIATGAIAAPWYVAVGVIHPEFGGYFFWFHNVVRYVQPFDHQGPPWQYLPGLVLSLMPWAVAIPMMIRDLVRHGSDSASKRPAALGAFLLMGLWGLAFFSLAGSKRPVYLVPLFAPLALAFGAYIDASLPRAAWLGTWTSVARYRSRIAYWSAATMLLGGVIVASASLAAGMNEPDRAVILAMTAGLSLAVLATKVRSRRVPWVVAGASTLLVLFAGTQTLMPEYARRFSLRHPVRMHAWKAVETDAPVACYPHRFDSVAFYTSRSDVREFRREERAAMMRTLEGKRPTLLVVQTKYLAEVLADLPPEMEFVARTQGAFTVGEVRYRRVAPPWGLAKAR